MKDPRLMHQIRCRKCNRLLMKGEVKHIEIKCPKCGYLQIVPAPEGSPDPQGSASAS